MERVQVRREAIVTGGARREASGARLLEAAKRDGVQRAARGDEGHSRRKTRSRRQRMGGGGKRIAWVVHSKTGGEREAREDDG